MLRQILEQRKFPVGHFNLLAVFHHPPALGENLQTAQLNYLRFCRPSTGEAGVAAEMGLDPGYQFRRIEGLGDVVVRSQAQPPNFIHRF